MSLRPQTPGSIPTETDRVAKAAFPQSNADMKMRDELGVFFFDEQLATLAPDGLKSGVEADWFTKYERQLDEYRLPQEKQERTAFAPALGTDGHRLLWEIDSQNAPEHLHSIEAVETMRAIWVQQYYIGD